MLCAVLLQESGIPGYEQLFNESIRRRMKQDHLARQARMRGSCTVAAALSCSMHAKFRAEGVLLAS